MICTSNGFKSLLQATGHKEILSALSRSKFPLLIRLRMLIRLLILFSCPEVRFADLTSKTGYGVFEMCVLNA
jgi:hypothetical protein